MVALCAGLPVTDKNITLAAASRVGAPPMIPTILGMMIEEVRAIFARPDFFDPISSFAARGY